MRHRFEHLRGHHHRSGVAHAESHDLLQEVRDLFDRHTHPEVAARDHDGVGDRDDLVEILHALAGLDLGHQHDVVTPQRRANRDHVESRSHEGDREDLEGLGVERFQALAVVVGGQAIVQQRRGQRQTGLAHDGPAGGDSGAGLGSNLLDQERHPAVTDMNLVALVELGQHVESFHDDVIHARGLVESLTQLDLVTHAEHDRRGAEGAGPDLGTGDIDHDRAVGHQGT